MSSKHWSVLAVEHLQRASNETTIDKVRRNLSITYIYIYTEAQEFSGIFLDQINLHFCYYIKYICYLC